MEKLARGESKGGRELVFDERTGRLETVRAGQSNPDQKVSDVGSFMEKLARGESKGGRELVFDERTGRLETVRTGQSNPDQIVATNMAQQGFFTSRTSAVLTVIILD